MKTFARLLSILLLALPVMVQAQSTSGLVRLEGRNALLGWEAIGRLDNAGVGFCTGTLIAPDQVLTAAHCVFTRDKSAVVSPENLIFRAGYDNGEAIAERQVTRIATLPDYSPYHSGNASHARNDLALLELDQPISTTDADPFALHSGPTKGLPVSVVSYGRGRAEALSRQKTCQVLGEQDGLIGFNCNVTYGSSGSPVFVKTGSRVRILSVISMMGTNTREKVAIGMDLAEPIAALKRQMRNARPAPVPVLRRIPASGGAKSTGAKFLKP